MVPSYFCHEPPPTGVAGTVEPDVGFGESWLPPQASTDQVRHGVAAALRTIPGPADGAYPERFDWNAVPTSNSHSSLESPLTLRLIEMVDLQMTNPGKIQPLCLNNRASPHRMFARFANSIVALSAVLHAGAHIERNCFANVVNAVGRNPTSGGDEPYPCYAGRRDAEHETPN
jgi:hypothetical protein